MKIRFYQRFDSSIVHRLHIGFVWLLVKRRDQKDAGQKTRKNFRIIKNSGIL